MLSENLFVHFCKYPQNALFYQISSLQINHGMELFLEIRKKTPTLQRKMRNTSFISMMSMRMQR